MIFRYISREPCGKYKESVICISAVDAKKEMYHTLLGYGIPKERIVGFSEMIIRCGKEVFKSDIAQESGNGFRQNILFDCMNGLGLGGVEAWSMQLAEELLKYGRSTFLVVPQNAKPGSQIGNTDFAGKSREKPGVFGSEYKRYCRKPGKKAAVYGDNQLCE